MRLDTYLKTNGLTLTIIALCESTVLDWFLWLAIGKLIVFCATYFSAMSYQSSPNKSDLSDDPLVKRIQESLDGLTIPLGRALGSKLALAATNEANVRKIPVNAMFTIIYVLCAVLMSGTIRVDSSPVCINHVVTLSVCINCIFLLLR